MGGGVVVGGDGAAAGHVFEGIGREADFTAIFGGDGPQKLGEPGIETG